MAHRYQLSKQARASLSAFLDAMNEFEGSLSDVTDTMRDEHAEHQEAFLDASDRWLESEQGAAVGDWIDTLEQYVSKLDELAELLRDIEPGQVEEKV